MRPVLACVVVGVLAGCAAAPLPRLTPPDLPARWRNAPAIAGSAAPSDPAGWWRRLGDPRLTALIARAMQEGPSVAALRERLLAARALGAGRDPRQLPELHLRTFDAVDPDASASFLLAGFDAHWELGFFGLAEGRQRQREAGTDAADAELAAAELSTAAEVAATWLGLGERLQRRRHLDRLAASTLEALRLLERRQQLGLAASGQLEEARAGWARARAAAGDATLQVETLANRLAVLTGAPAPDPAWLQLRELPPVLPDIAAPLPAELLRARPDIRRAEAAVLAAAGDVDVARAARLPRFSIGGMLLTSMTLTHVRPTGEHTLATAAPGIDIPLFDWGARAAQLDANRHLLAAATDEYRDVVLQAIGEVETQLAQLASLREHHARLDEATAAADRAHAVVQQRVRLGLASPLEEQAALRESLQAEQERDEAALHVALGWISLCKALGAARLPTDESPG